MGSFPLVLTKARLKLYAKINMVVKVHNWSGYGYPKSLKLVESLRMASSATAFKLSKLRSDFVWDSVSLVE